MPTAMNFDIKQFHKACHNEQVSAPFLKNLAFKTSKRMKEKWGYKKDTKVSHVVRKAFDIFNNIVSAFPFYFFNRRFLSQNLLSVWILNSHNW